MCRHDVVCSHTGEILYTSPFLYMCDKFIRDNNLAGAVYIYDTLPNTPEVVEYFSGYFDLQMIAIRIQCMSK